MHVANGLVKVILMYNSKFKCLWNSCLLILSMKPLWNRNRDILRILFVAVKFEIPGGHFSLHSSEVLIPLIGKHVVNSVCWCSYFPWNTIEAGTGTSSGSPSLLLSLSFLVAISLFTALRYWYPSSVNMWLNQKCVHKLHKLHKQLWLIKWRHKWTNGEWNRWMKCYANKVISAVA